MIIFLLSIFASKLTLQQQLVQKRPYVLFHICVKAGNISLVSKIVKIVEFYIEISLRIVKKIYIVSEWFRFKSNLIENTEVSSSGFGRRPEKRIIISNDYISNLFKSIAKTSFGKLHHNAKGKTIQFG